MLASVAHPLSIVAWLGMTIFQYRHTIQLLTAAHLEPNIRMNSLQTNSRVYSVLQLHINGTDCTTPHQRQRRGKLANTPFQTLLNILYVRYSTMSYHFLGCCFLWETFPANPGHKHGWIEGGWRWENIAVLRDSKNKTIQGDAPAICFALYPSRAWHSVFAKLLLYLINSLLLWIQNWWNYPGRDFNLHHLHPFAPLPCLYTTSPTDKISGVWHEVLGLGFLGCWDLLVMVPLKGRLHRTNAAFASDYGKPNFATNTVNQD